MSCCFSVSSGNARSRLNSNVKATRTLIVTNLDQTSSKDLLDQVFCQIWQGHCKYRQSLDRHSCHSTERHSIATLLLLSCHSNVHTFNLTYVRSEILEIWPGFLIEGALCYSGRVSQ